MSIMDFLTGEKIKTWTWRMRLARLVLAPIMIPLFVIVMIPVGVLCMPILACIHIYEHVKYGKDIGI
jgi:hypothetical protein